MTRNRATAKKAGAAFERLVADYLAEHVDDRIDRKAKTGAKDKGDIGGVRFVGWHREGATVTTRGGKVAVECKDTAKPSLAAWAAEAEAERINDGALVGLVVHKRHGVSAAGDQWVTCTLRDLATLLSGARPDHDTTREPNEGASA